MQAERWQNVIVITPITEVVRNMVESDSQSFDSICVELDLRHNDTINQMHREHQNDLNLTESTKRGIELAEVVMAEYNKYLQPWLLITKDKMKQIGIKHIDVQLRLSHRFHQTLETAFYPSMNRYINAAIDSLRITHSHFDIVVENKFRF